MKNAVDVIKVLETCFYRDGCKDCPYENLDIESCSRAAVADAIDVMKKLQSENEALKAELIAAQQAINSMKSKLMAAGLYSN